MCEHFFHFLNLLFLFSSICSVFRYLLSHIFFLYFSFYTCSVACSFFSLFYNAFSHIFSSIILAPFYCIFLELASTLYPTKFSFNSFIFISCIFVHLSQITTGVLAHWAWWRYSWQGGLNQCRPGSSLSEIIRIQIRIFWLRMPQKMWDIVFGFSFSFNYSKLLLKLVRRIW